MDEKLIKGILLVDELRRRFKKLNIGISSIGQFRGEVFIYLENISDSEWIREFLMDDEKEIVKFFKA